ncbi:hypothetical protein HA402_007115 [Bradysia odoriphaga]|nr:hypothetical protein HA402_007115 [Bradysia odoriphaga]
MELFRIFYLLLLNFFVTGTNISQTTFTDWHDQTPLKIAPDNAKPDVSDYRIHSNATKSQTSNIKTRRKNFTGTKPKILDGGLSSNLTKTEILDNRTSSNTPQQRIPDEYDTVKPSYLSDDVKSNKTEPEIVDNGKNTDTIQPNLFVGDIKSNAVELTEPTETAVMKYNATNQEVSGDAIDSNATKLPESAVPDCATNFIITTTPKMIDAVTKSNTTEQYPSDNKLKSEETGHYLTVTVALISFVLCASCLYLIRDKLKIRRKGQNPYSCVNYHNGEY